MKLGVGFTRSAQVRQYPDPVLRMKANDVDEIDDSVTGLVEDVKGAHVGGSGHGPRSSAVGILRRVFVYQAGEEEPFGRWSTRASSKAARSGSPTTKGASPSARPA